MKVKPGLLKNSRIVFLNNSGQKRFAFNVSAKDKNKVPSFKIELHNCLAKIKAVIFSSSFCSALCSCATNKPRAPGKATLISMSKHTFFNTNFQWFSSLIHWEQQWQCVNLATPHARQGHVPDWTPRCASRPNWLKDYGITEREKNWEWNTGGIGRKRQNAGSRIASLFVDWHRLQERRCGSEGKQTTSPALQFRLC